VINFISFVLKLIVGSFCTQGFYRTNVVNLCCYFKHTIEARAWKLQKVLGDERKNTRNQFENYYSKLSQKDKLRIDNWNAESFLNSLMK
jgi:hypothetical protein